MGTSTSGKLWYCGGAWHIPWPRCTHPGCNVGQGAELIKAGVPFCYGHWNWQNILEDATDWVTVA